MSDPSPALPSPKRVLTVPNVVFFTVVAVFSLRNVATAAKLGPGVVGLWGLAIATYFLPLGLAVSELGTRDPGEGGFYRWTRAAFGDTHGFLAGWFYWVSNISYLPTLLSVVVLGAAYAAGRPDLEDSPWIACGAALGLLWLAAWANVRGFETGRWITNAGGLAAWLAAGLVIVAGGVAAARYGSAARWDGPTMTGVFDDWHAFGYFGTLVFALGGLELIAVVGGEVRDPRRTLPRATLLAGSIIGGLYVAGTVAVLIALPAERASPITGAIDAIREVADRADWGFLTTVGAGLVAVSAAACLFAYLGAVARLPFAAGLDHLLPAVMARTHPRYGTPHVAIYGQTAVTSVFILAAQAGGTVREAFLILLDLTIILTAVPFLYIFLAVPRLRPAGPEPGVAHIPGGRCGLWVVALAGAATTVLSIVSAVIPTPDIESPGLFEAKIWGGLVLFGTAGYAVVRTFRTERRAASVRLVTGPRERRSAPSGR
jgi:amino acid transporter